MSKTLILLIVLSIVEFSYGQNDSCIVYINSESTNTGKICGLDSKVTDACQSLHQAYKSCYSQNLSNSMIFNFANGSYEIPNNVPLGIYNQTITIQGNNDIDNPTYFTFQDDSGAVITINEPSISKDNDLTVFLMDSIVIKGLNSPFIEANSLEYSSIKILITSCVFNEISLSNTSQIFNINSKLMSNSEKSSEIEVISSSFTNVKKSEYNQDSIGMVINAYNTKVTFDTCLFLNITGNSSLIQANYGEGLTINKCIFNSSTFYYAINGTNLDKNNIVVTGNTFTQLKQIDNLDNLSYLINSIDSGSVITLNTFTNNNFGLLFINGINENYLNQFNNNTISKNTSPFFYIFGNFGSIAQVNFNSWISNSANKEFVGNQFGSLEFIGNLLNSNNGSIVYLEYSKGYVQNNTFTNNNDLVVVICYDSKFYTNSSTNNNSNTIISPVSSIYQIASCNSCTWNSDVCDSTSTNSNDNNNNNNNKTNIGIGVGVGIASGIILCIVAIILYRRVKSQRRRYIPLHH